MPVVRAQFWCTATSVLLEESDHEDSFIGDVDSVTICEGR